MKLVPLPRFWGRKRSENESDLTDEFPEDVLQLLPEDQAAVSEDEENPEKAAEETSAESQPEQEEERVDDLLNVFLSVDEEFVDNSGLLKDVDDVPATELLAELRVLAAAFGARPRRSPGSTDSEA